MIERRELCVYTPCVTGMSISKPGNSCGVVAEATSSVYARARVYNSGSINSWIYLDLIPSYRPQHGGVDSHSCKIKRPCIFISTFVQSVLENGTIFVCTIAVSH
jgi:hypothetical protein